MNSHNPPVTILLPTFNRRDFLPAAIKSVLAQTFADWRLLVLNDGGDSVADIVSGFGDPRIECHGFPHRGKAATLNAGLALVESKYVAYMDDDDIVYPDHLAELVAAAECENAEFVYSDTWLVVLEPDGTEQGRRIENDADVSFDDIRCYNRINHKQILHTKRLADEAGPYDERLRILIDYDYIRRLAKIVRPVHCRKTTGEHFLRLSSDKVDNFASISGLWISDPEACGRSVAAIFADDPAALAEIYRDASALAGTRAQLEASIAGLRAQLDVTVANLDGCRAELDRTREMLRARDERLEIVEASLSYRLGRATTAPLRLVAEAARRIRRK